MNTYGFPCKTPGCEAWLKLGEMQEDSSRSIHHPINLGDEVLRLQCPDCGKAHDYNFSENKIRRLVP
jgi:hypothetical protein